MKKDIADKWVAALRSGHYKQCKDMLKDPKTNSYCCLGVLTEICGFDPLVEKYGDFEYLSENVQKFTEMKSNRGKRYSEYNIESLAELNDLEVGFNEIADIIEKEWETL